ncbi:hypothetical protein HBB16_08960 [Pseudonocardia sp. MCCB 268]|nr:hypothetical protein [Pseudonocardia cytotoxica]
MAGIAPEPEHTTANTTSVADDDRLHRTLDWKGRLLIASGVRQHWSRSPSARRRHDRAPSAGVGVSITAFGLVQSFIWAEIAGPFPRNRGPGLRAMAWVRYSKLVAPLSVCNWLAWSPKR